MKFPRLLILSLVAGAVGVLLPAQTTPKPLEPVKVAFINSSLFLDEATGIKQLIKAFNSLELEFSTTKSELSLIREKIKTLDGDLNRLKRDAVANAAAIQEKQAEGQKLMQEFQTKSEAAQAAVTARRQEIEAPVTTEIGKELRLFAKEHDLGLLFDVAKMEGAILDAKPELDLTAEFVTYYNNKHK